MRIAGFFFAFLAGALLIFSFAPFSIYPIGIISLAVLLWLWRWASPARAFCLGWVFGFFYFLMSYSWLYAALNRADESISYGLIAALFFFIVLWAHLFAFQGYFLKKFFSKREGVLFFIAYPASWVLVEWLCGSFFLINGFPWLVLGNSQVNGPLAGFAPIFGTYGLTYLIALTSAGFLYLLSRPFEKKSLLVSFCLLVIWGAGFFLKGINWTTPGSGWLKIVLVQKNDRPDAKLESRYYDNVVSLNEEILNSKPNVDLIIWPENTFSITDAEAEAYLKKIEQLGRRNHVEIIMGSWHRQGDQFYNAIILLGNARSLYLKRNLVPLSEYRPESPWLQYYLNSINLGFSDFSEGQREQAPLIVKDNIKIVSLICFEVIFQALSREPKYTPALMVAISNDYWLHGTYASAQILQIKQMRALENGRYFITAVNYGFSAIINPKGEIVKVMPQYQSGLLRGEVQAMKGNTPWSNWGNMPLVFYIIMSLLVGYFRK